MNSDFTCLARFYIMYCVVGAVFVDCCRFQLDVFVFFCSGLSQIFAQLMIVDCIVDMQGLIFSCVVGHLGRGKNLILFFTFVTPAVVITMELIEYNKH